MEDPIHVDKPSKYLHSNLILSRDDLANYINAAVDLTVKKLFPYVDQTSILTHITKWQAKDILNISLKTLSIYAVNGKKMYDGDYYTLKPNGKGHYDYTEVLEFKKLLTHEK